jgi:hypothetical protein
VQLLDGVGDRRGVGPGQHPGVFTVAHDAAEVGVGKDDRPAEREEFRQF